MIIEINFLRNIISFFFGTLRSIIRGRFHIPISFKLFTIVEDFARFKFQYETSVGNCYSLVCDAVNRQLLVIARCFIEIEIIFEFL